MAEAFEALVPGGHKRLVNKMKEWVGENADGLVSKAVDKALPYKLQVREDVLGHKRVAIVGAGEEQ